MADEILYRGTLTLAGLQTKMRSDEALELMITAIDVTNDDTVGTYQDGTVTARSLCLFLDPAGNLPTPSDMTLICRGKARILGSEHKVALFRKQI